MSVLAHNETGAAETTLTTLALTVGRVLLAIIFILAGFAKLTSPAQTAAYMSSAGVPGLLLPLVILVELGGGLLLLVGYQTRYVALALFGFTLLAGILFHNNFADQNQMTHFLKNLAMAGGFLYVFAAGAGRFSVDGWRANR